MDSNRTVVIGMSGGVDSSVAALLLHEQGYNCIGVTMKLWDYELVGGNLNHESGCCSLDSINDARMVCAKIGIPHYTLNFSRQFHQDVVDDFIFEYMAGRTPNPCVQCNLKIKWQTLIEKALELGADYIATGHYARVVFADHLQRYQLYRGKDQNKDQSYALWGIRQNSLDRTLFPLAELTKPEVREIARQFGLRTAEKSESMEICFVADNDYHRFLRQVVPSLNERIGPGELIDSERNVLGRHEGYPFYTIGQRKGLGGGFARPMYVLDTDPLLNRVIIGGEEELFSDSMLVKNVNFVSIGGLPDEGLACTVKIRYKDSGHDALIFAEDDGQIRVEFDQPAKAVTPGQSAVFYARDLVLAGGIIQSFSRQR